MTWIKVEAKLPAQHETKGCFHRVLIYAPEMRAFPSSSEERSCVDTGCYIHELEEWRIWGENTPIKVTHWMPMPQGPHDQKGTK